MNVVDSSGWLEYLADGPNAQFFAPAVEDVAALVVPTISLYEVFKRVLQQADEGRSPAAVCGRWRPGCTQASEEDLRRRQRERRPGRPRSA